MEMASAISIPVSINSQENQDKKVKEEPIKKKKKLSLFAQYLTVMFCITCQN